MNIKEYISSGIIESYVLGLASAGERAEFEKLCAIYPELVEERDKFEAMVEHHALNNSRQPPAAAGSHLFERIIATPISPAEVIDLSQRSSAASVKRLRYLAAASVIVLLGCACFFYRLQVQNNSLSNTNKQLQARYNATDSVLHSIVDARKVLKDDNLSLVEMTGTTESPKSSAGIYWDSASAAVYMVVQDLPPLPANRQYQLWALLDGKPKSLGVFDATSNRVILKMKDCKKAEAFSITVEPKGGNTAPSPGKVQATGKAGNL